MEIALSVIERIGKAINPDFRLIPGVLPVYEELIRYFHGDPAYKGDLTKGVLLMGPTGTGKSVALEIMQRYRQIDDIKYIVAGRTYRMNYEIYDVNHIVSHFMKDSFDGIDQYCVRYVLALDDIGTEIENVKHFGNTLDVISYIISERYSRRLLTFGTTNFPLAQLETKYSDRITSRMNAMFNFIVVRCEDFRRMKKTA